ncbi:MAG TPA: delta-60 repeat domain-containing protein [Rhodanobacteraceae bacterium]|nr:delta-60 repeat domain-containing protein [Rhodanobacteraceae bacterium]
MEKARAALAAALGLIVGAASAHDGGFFDGFGIQGREQIGFSPFGITLGFVTFVDLAVQPDGKIVVSATVDNETSDDIGVLRLNPNGTLDTDFGIQGQRITGFDGGGANDDVASSMLLQPNGRIVVCGVASGDPNTNGSDFGIVRLTSAGAIDTQFSVDGRATVAFDLGPSGSRDDFAVRCSLQADGKIVAAGQAEIDSDGNGRMAVARLNTDGTRDTGFNGSGTATIDFGPGFPSSTAFGVKSLANGDTLLIGNAATSDLVTASWAFARLDPAGELDATFGNGGIVLFDSGFASYRGIEAVDAVVLPDNSFVAVGVMDLQPGPNLDIGVFKLTPNGSLDTSWGINGGQIIPYDLGSSFSDVAFEIIQDGQGRFVIVGLSIAASIQTTNVTRLTADGQLDPLFGLGGKLIVASAPPPNDDLGDAGTTVALTADGGLLVGSIATTNASPNGLYVGLAKLVADTVFDNGFEFD